MQIIAPAKINLCLDILKKDSTGYHQIQTIFAQAKSPHDTLEINAAPETQITSSPQSTEKTPIHPQENLIKKALDLLTQHGLKEHYKIELTKNIPLASGLGGGSSDAAATLAAINDLSGLNLPKTTLSSLAAQLGSDVPFFISQTPCALGTNYGEKIEPISTKIALNFEIQLLDQPKVSTAQAYASLDLSNCGQNTTKTQKAIAALKANDLPALQQNLHNDFTQLYDVPQGWHLSGSGPAIFRLI